MRASATMRAVTLVKHMCVDFVGKNILMLMVCLSPFVLGSLNFIYSRDDVIDEHYST